MHSGPTVCGETQMHGLTTGSCATLCHWQGHGARHLPRCRWPNFFVMRYNNELSKLNRPASPKASTRLLLTRLHLPICLRQV